MTYQSPLPPTAEGIEARWAHQRNVEHLALVAFIEVALLVGAAAALFAGGDLGLLVAPAMLILSTFSTVDLARTGLRVIRGSHQITTSEVGTARRSNDPGPRAHADCTPGQPCVSGRGECPFEHQTN